MNDASLGALTCANGITSPEGNCSNASNSGNTRQPYVFVVDGDERVLRALAHLFPGYAIQTFSCARDFLAHADIVHAPACLLLDLRLPDLDGLAVQREVGAVLPVIFLTGHADINTTVRAMKAGACDVLPKPVTETILLQAVKHAILRASRMFERRRELAEIERCLSQLSSREQAVMAGVVMGLLNKQIAARMGVAIQTVKVHRGRVMAKMNAKSVPELIRMVDKANAAREDPL
ncbi:FixJ family two-component response regulator [Paraburkholderia sp. GAS448]|uniref:response regulator transcription factor n=1 Tax=Paraburkholderia sp. GAS448 TaxID=3035136 RepID=UPI003D253042